MPWSWALSWCAETREEDVGCERSLLSLTLELESNGAEWLVPVVPLWLLACWRVARTDSTAPPATPSSCGQCRRARWGGNGQFVRPFVLVLATHHHCTCHERRGVQSIAAASIEGSCVLSRSSWAIGRVLCSRCTPSRPQGTWRYTSGGPVTPR